MNDPVNILLVDDESRNLDTLESLLQTPEYELVRALTPEAALMALLDGDFAVIVLDIQMPAMNGLELANIIKQRKRTQHIPIIFLTAYFQEDKDVLQGYGTGAVDYLTKPIKPQILRSKIAVFADLFRKTRALAAANATLETEVRQRQRAEEALRESNNELEARVQARAADLIRVNQELREHEAALRVSEAQAIMASRAKDDFLATLSHELRTPLNPVLLLSTEAAANPDLPAEVRANFETIARNVRLEARLIDDLLDLTAITRGKPALKKRPFDAHDILQEALAMVRSEIERKQIDLLLKLDAGWHTVLGDDVRLKQVFWNVIANAAKFTPDRGRITLATSAPTESGNLTVTIADTGIGMTPPELERVFTAFKQGDHAANGTDHRFGGLGLGLAISRKMLELHAGSIAASSNGRNQGSAFVIKLPLLRRFGKDGPAAGTQPPAAIRVPPQSGTNGHGQPRRILLVEDHNPTAHALTQLLTRRKYEVVAASCLAEARVFAGRENFDLLISDIGLPDGNGYELMAELRNRRGFAGIALTGYGMNDDVDCSRAAGFAAHLTKPVSAQALDVALAVASRLDAAGTDQAGTPAGDAASAAGRVK